ncbi:hypothetical protein SCHPADRAFT_353842 [Schizopora paradoxa]|uniref:Hydrophobin n=1 Tax=Schizopora paradoxa TaxID=27342 RepID=A0A0H2RW58_9AGAM|nr:hypothetical protein SCHPADRAFT_353842 [Schizopora paradoxa]
MNQRTLVAFFCVAVSGVFAAPSPIDPNTAHIVAVNNNIACSSGSCAAGNSSVLETMNSDDMDAMSSSGTSMRFGSNVWSTSSLAVVTLGSLALSYL